MCVCVGGGGGGSSGGEPKVPENLPTYAFLRYYVVVSVFPYSLQLSWKHNCYFYC